MTEDEDTAAWRAERKREWEAEVAAAGGLEAWRNQPGEWVQKHEHIAHAHPYFRLRTIVEVNDFKYRRTLERDDEAWEQSIDVYEQDCAQFAKELMDGMFQETSPAQMAVIRDVLIAYLDNWHAERVASYKAHPDLFGTELPEPL